MNGTQPTVTNPFGSLRNIVMDVAGGELGLERHGIMALIESAVDPSLILLEPTLAFVDPPGILWTHLKFSGVEQVEVAATPSNTAKHRRFRVFSDHQKK